MINKKKISALLLSGAMLMGMNTSVFAANGLEEGTKNNPATISITKDFEIPEGLTSPNVTFQFTVTKVTQDAPDATINGITYSNADTNAIKDGKKILTKTSSIDFGVFPHAGIYEYKVVENKGNTDGIKYDNTEYTIQVAVANADDGSLYVKTISSKDNKEKKPIKFVNIYKKDDGSLIIEKQTIGELADKTKDFDFTIEFKKSPTSEQTEFKGMIGDKEVICTVGQKVNFKLHDKQQLVFKNIPVGARYTVTEKEAQDGYTPSVIVIENGNKSQIKTANEKDSLSSADNGNTNLVGEKTNKVEFTNTYEDKPITGIVMNNLPFILMIGVATLGFGALAIIKRRKTLR